MSTKTNPQSTRPAKRESPIDTLCWVQNRLDAGADDDLVSVMKSKEPGFAVEIGDAMRASIGHQIIKMGGSNYHTHFFSIPVVITSIEEITADQLALDEVLPTIMKVLRENGIGDRNGMIVNRLIEQGTITDMSPSDLYALGRDMAMTSMVRSGAARGVGSRLRTIAGLERADKSYSVDGMNYFSGHVLGCIYSQKAVSLDINPAKQARISSVVRAALEFQVGGHLSLQLKVGPVEPICKAMSRLIVMYADAIAEKLFQDGCDGFSDEMVDVFVENSESSVLEHQVLVSLKSAANEISTMVVSVSMLESNALEDILKTIHAQANLRGVENITVRFAANETRH